MEPRRPLETVPGAVSALVLGILGLVLCPIFGPFAWSYGAQAEKTASRGRYSGAGMATAGKILGIIGTVFLAIMIVLLIVAAASDSVEFSPGSWWAVVGDASFGYR